FTGQEPPAEDVEDFSRYVEKTLSRNR
ncbi:TetR/AcrR family transcriptional regulator, partial [Mesorhizobium sp. M7A.F.Ca.CA.003.01.2.1]